MVKHNTRGDRLTPSDRHVATGDGRALTGRLRARCRRCRIGRARAHSCEQRAVSPVYHYMDVVTYSIRGSSWNAIRAARTNQYELVRRGSRALRFGFGPGTGEWLRCRVAAATDVEAEAAAEAELNNLEEEQVTTAV